LAEVPRLALRVLGEQAEQRLVQLVQLPLVVVQRGMAAQAVWAAMDGL